MISAIASTGVYLVSSNYTGPIAMEAMLMTLGLLLYQFRANVSFWERSITDDCHKNPEIIRRYRSGDSRVPR